MLIEFRFMAWIGHTNVRTPRWLGYVVSRPENHALHHARGLHRYNYADLPLIDWLFGTFRNPEHAPNEVGFWDGASQKTAALLLGRDVSEGPEPLAVESAVPTSRTWAIRG